MLWILEALLLILSALGQDHRAADEGLTLDMAPNSVDDLYFGCRKNMTGQVKKNYLKKELNNSANFKNAWEKSEKNVSRSWIWKKLKKEHKIAIYIYSHPTFKIYREFNNDTRHGKQNYTSRKFKWYSLYFLLTDAIQILRTKQNTCLKTFRGTNVTLKGDVSTNIRFGSFASSSLSRAKAQDFGRKSCFEIQTCLGADVTKYSRLPLEKEVLIPPYETFNITAIKRRSDQTKLWCETVYVLNSTGIRSALNCALFNNLTETAGNALWWI